MGGVRLTFGESYLFDAHIVPLICSDDRTLVADNQRLLLEVSHREQSFNMVFKRAPAVGRLDPLAAAGRGLWVDKRCHRPCNDPQARCRSVK